MHAASHHGFAIKLWQAVDIVTARRLIAEGYHAQVLERGGLRIVIGHIGNKQHINIAVVRLADIAHIYIANEICEDAIHTASGV